MSNKIPLADRPGPLKRDEIQCPICWSILIEPVALPCRHCLCLECFKKHVEETSLQCPCCRMRLSVWSRKAFREKNLVDVKLWERIKREFPMLVQTRLCGEDSQELDPRDLKSVYDRENEPESEPQMELGSQSFRREGDFSSATGEIRLELEGLLKAHKEDIENQRILEERESAKLIRQLQEQEQLEVTDQNNFIIADVQLAKKLEEDEKHALLAEISTRRKLFTENSESALSKKSASAGNKLISEWTITVSPNHTSPDTSTKGAARSSWVETPKRTGKRTSLTSLSSRSSKKMKNSKISSIRFSKDSKSSSIKSSSQPHSSQNSLLTYMFSSQTYSRSSSSSVLDSPQPSTSSAAIAGAAKSVSQFQPNVRKEVSSTVTSDHNYSAFSPTKSISNKGPTLIPRDLVYNNIVLKPSNRVQFTNLNELCIDIDIDSQKGDDDLCEEKDTPTPNSIDSEVNSYFRPIRSAPKTPPKRRPDGTYLPEPVVVKTTPLRPTPPMDLEIEKKVVSKFITSPTKANKITSADGGKRISDDSGRASLSSFDSVILLSDSDSSCTEKSEMSVSQNKVKEKTVSSKREDTETLDIPKLTAIAKFSAGSHSHSNSVRDGSTMPPLLGIISSHVAPYECLNSSSFSNDSSAEELISQDQNDVEADIKWLIEESEKSQPTDSSQKSVKIDLIEVNRQAEEFERIRQKVLQESEDRKFAKKLQKDLNTEQPRAGNPYSIRSWLKRETRSSRKTT